MLKRQLRWLKDQQLSWGQYLYLPFKGNCNQGQSTRTLNACKSIGSFDPDLVFKQVGGDVLVNKDQKAMFKLVKRL